MSELNKKLINIQSKLKAPKNLYNDFNKFNYRSAEDILNSLKPLLAEQELSLIISDNLVSHGDRYYIKATCTLSDGESTIESSAYAREVEDKKGMDQAQITGSVSSYARKYALNGMFLIDDSKDPDCGDNVKTKTGLSYQDVKEKLLTLNTKEDIDTYSKEVKKSFDGVDAEKGRAIAAAFRIRRAEIDNS